MRSSFFSVTCTVGAFVSSDRKADQKQKKEQRQAAVQKQELVNKQMATYMDKFFKPLEKSSAVSRVSLHR